MVVDPASLIVLALVKGLVQGIAQSAAKGGYLALRTQIVGRYGQSVEASISRLEEDPASLYFQENVAHELRSAGAGHDRVLTELAQNFLDLVENFDPDTGSTPNLADPVEQVRRSAGVDAISQILQQHIQRVSTVRASRKMDDVDLLTGKIVQNEDLPRELQESAKQLHGKIQNIIYQIAVRIEDARYQEVELTVSELATGLAGRERARTLVQMDKSIHISYETLRLTVEFFRDLNRTVLANIEKEHSPQQLSNMMFGNAIMIYELTDFMIGYIRDFALGDGLGKLHADAKKRVQEARDRQDKLKTKVQDSNIEPDVRDQTLENIRNREAAFDKLDREWDTYLHEIQQLKETVKGVQGKIPTLEVIRENAEVQIMALQEIAMLRFLKQNSESVRGAVETLQEFRLAPLSSTRVQRLLGV
jgi:hypothetical protein